MAMAGKSPSVGRSFDVSSKKFAIVASRWNETIVQKLVNGAVSAFESNGCPSVEIIWVPGAWEIPVAALKQTQKSVDGIVCVGCILQGATVHAQQLSNAVSSGLAQIALSKGIAIGHGVLTCANEEEAFARAGGELGNKGEEAALAVIEMSLL